MTRGFMIAIPAVIVVLLAALLVAPNFIDWNSYKPQIQAQLKTATGYDAQLKGDISIAFLPTPRAFIANVEIAAPQGSANDYLVKLARLDVHLGFIPLLSGHIAFDSINLVEPAIALEVMTDGRNNWMTPELEKMIGPKEGAGGEKDVAGTQQPAANADYTQSISLKNISIEKGAFTYLDRSKGEAAPTTISDVNIDASADTLRGPFSVKGSVTVAGQTIEINGDTGALDSSGSVSLKADGTAKPAGLKFAYAGVVTTAQPFQAQGETSFEVTSLKQLTGQKDLSFDTDRIALKGLLTANKDKVEYKNASFELAGNKFSGDLSAALTPLKVTGDFSASDPINLDKFIKASGGGSKSSGGGKGDAASGGPAVPETLSLPVSFDANIKLAAPSMVYGGKVYSGVTIEALKQDKSFALGMTAKNIPGKGNLDVKASLVYASKSVSQKDKTETYSEPSALIAVKAQAENIEEMASAISGRTDLKIPDMWKRAVIDANMTLKGRSLSFKDSQVKLGGDQFVMAGSIGDLKNLSAINATVSGQVQDIKALLKLAGMDTTSLPKDLAGGNVALAVKGSPDKMDVTANVKAMKGELAVQGQVVNAGGKMAFNNMAIQVKHPDMAEAIQDFAPASPHYASLEKPFDFYGELQQDGTVYSFKNMKATVAGSPVTGTFSINTGAKKPDVKADVTLQNLELKSSPADSGAAQQSATSGGSSGGGKKSGHWSAEPIDSGWMNAFNLALSVKATSISYEGWDLQKPVIDIALRDGKMDIKQLETDLFGGRASVTGGLEGAAGGKGFSAINAAISMKSVSVEELVKALAGSHVLKGQGDMNMDAKINTAGASQAEIVSAMNGNGTINGKDIVLDGFDLAKFTGALSSGKPMDRIDGLWQSTASGGSTSFQTMDGAYTIDKGIVNITKMNMDGTQATLATTGNLNLPAYTMDTTNTITLKPQTGQTASDVPPPFTIKLAGSLDNPGQSFGQGAINDYLKSKLGAKLQNTLTKKLGGDAGGALGALLGVPQQPEAAPAAGGATGTPTGTAAPAQTAPAAGADAQQTAPQSPADAKQAKKQKKQEAINGLINGLLGH